MTSDYVPLLFSSLADSTSNANANVNANANAIDRVRVRVRVRVIFLKKVEMIIDHFSSTYF